MSHLLVGPRGTSGHVHDVTPGSAGWGYVGFGLWNLAPGERAAAMTGGREVILVLVEGRARIAGAGQDRGEMGDRMSLQDRAPPHALYLPSGVDWGGRGHEPLRPGRLLRPEGIELASRGRDTDARHVNSIAMEGRDVAGSLLVTEVFTPAGHWSSYPGHRHDEDDFPRITHLEETYHHRLNPAAGWAVQRVRTEDGSLDETMAVRDGDVTLVPRGHHPCGAPYGFDLHYLNVMAGPRRQGASRATPSTPGSSSATLERPRAWGLGRGHHGGRSRSARCQVMTSGPSRPVWALMPAISSAAWAMAASAWAGSWSRRAGSVSSASR